VQDSIEFQGFRLMNKTAWKNAIEAIGVLSIVASLVFVGLEVQQSTRAAIDASLSSDTSIIIDTESLVLSHPDVWRRGCLAELSDPTEQLIYSRIHHAYVFNYYLRWLRSTMGMESSSGPLAVDNIAMNIYRYAGFQAEWDAHGLSRQHLDDSVRLQVFRQLVDDRVKEYPSFEPVPLSDTSRCGLI
jgi:hypothetical protein